MELSASPSCFLKLFLLSMLYAPMNAEFELGNYKVIKKEFRLGLLNRIHVKSSKLRQNHIHMSGCPESFSTFNDLIHLSACLPAISIPLH